MLETKKKPKITESKRADKKRNVAKVLSTVIKKPLSTYRDIAKETGLGLGTVDRAIDDLVQSGTKTQEIQDICKKDFQIMELVQGITINRLQNPENESFQDIIRAGAESTKRYTIFKGNITDKDGGMRNLSFEQLKSMTLEELNEYKNNLFK